MPRVKAQLLALPDKWELLYPHSDDIAGIRAIA